MAIENNSLVKIHYKGTLTDGSVFDTSEGKNPLEFIFGIGMVIPGLEKGLLGLDKGDKRTIDIAAADAYGPVMEQAIQEVPKEQFPADIKLEEGMQLAAQGPQGVIPVKVKEIKDKIVVVDFNHPLAGQDLKFEVEVVDVASATEEDKQRILGPIMGNGCAGGCSDCNGAGCASMKDNKEESLEDALEEKEEEKKEE